MSSPHAGFDSKDPTLVVRHGDDNPSATFATMHGDEPPANAFPLLVQQLDDFRIVREIGRGGMGVVYEAVQQSLNRRVALKMLSLAALHNETHRRRFLREAQAAARMHHTNIVPVFRVGEVEGTPYYAMQYIEGHGLDVLLRQSGDEAILPPAGTAAGIECVARLGLQAAEGLAHAHAHGLVHRDIKPGNLLLDHSDNLWITDFGLARTAEDEDLTKTGNIVGTMRYMSPERFKGECAASGDLYALGVTLYELATRQIPFPSHDQTQLLQQILDTEPPRPTRLNQALPRDLETIILKAMAARVSDRYDSARALADDLRAFLEGKPIQARRRSLPERFLRWSRRNPVISLLTIVSFTLALLAAVLGVGGYLQERAALEGQKQEREKAELARLKAEEARDGQAQERERAERTLGLAIAALDHVFQRLGGGEVLSGTEDNAPVVSEQTAALLQELLVFYERFAAENTGDGRLPGETARAQQRIGDIQFRLGQYDRAEKTYRAALQNYEALARAQPTEPRWVKQEAEVLDDIGLTLHLLGRHQEALEPLVNSAKLYEHLRDFDPDDEAYAYGLALVLYRQATVNRHPRAIRTADTQALEARTLLEKLRQQDPHSSCYRLSLARVIRLQAILDRGLGRGPSGERLQQSITMLEDLVKDQPRMPDYRSELIETYLTIGPDLFATPVETLRPRVQRAVELAQELNRDYPGVASYEAHLGRALTRRGEIHRLEREQDAAERTLKQANAQLDRLVKRQPSVPSLLLPQAEARFALARLQCEQDRLEAARTTLLEGIDVTQRYVDQTRHSIPALRLLTDHYRLLSAVLLQMGQPREADELMRKAEQAERKLGGPPAPPPRRP